MFLRDLEKRAGPPARRLPRVMVPQASRATIAKSTRGGAGGAFARAVRRSAAAARGGSAAAGVDSVSGSENRRGRGARGAMS